MFVQWLRNNVYASVLLLIARLYIGWQWLSGGWEKLTAEQSFSASKFLENAVAHPVTSHNEVIYPAYTDFLQSFALPNIDLFNVLIPLGEFAVGLGLILGCLTTAAGFFGVMMNFAFLLAGTVSSNPWLIMFAIFLLVGGRNTGAIGLDRYLLPWFDRWFKKTPSKSGKLIKSRLGIVK